MVARHFEHRLYGVYRPFLRVPRVCGPSYHDSGDILHSNLLVKGIKRPYEACCVAAHHSYLVLSPRLVVVRHCVERCPGYLMLLSALPYGLYSVLLVEALVGALAGGIHNYVRLFEHLLCGALHLYPCALQRLNVLLWSVERISFLHGHEGLVCGGALRHTYEFHVVLHANSVGNPLSDGSVSIYSNFHLHVIDAQYPVI